MHYRAAWRFQGPNVEFAVSRGTMAEGAIKKEAEHSEGDGQGNISWLAIKKTPATLKHLKVSTATEIPKDQQKCIIVMRFLAAKVHILV